MFNTFSAPPPPPPSERDAADTGREEGCALCMVDGKVVRVGEVERWLDAIGKSYLGVIAHTCMGDVTHRRMWGDSVAQMESRVAHVREL